MPYVLFAVTCGVPLFVLDTCIGQYTKQSAATSWGKLCLLAEGDIAYLLTGAIANIFR